jgi:hypothetical protein
MTEPPLQHDDYDLIEEELNDVLARWPGFILDAIATGG